MNRLHVQFLCSGAAHLFTFAQTILAWKIHQQWLYDTLRGCVCCQRFESRTCSRCTNSLVTCYDCTRTSGGRMFLLKTFSSVINKVILILFLHLRPHSMRWIISQTDLTHQMGSPSKTCRRTKHPCAKN